MGGVALLLAATTAWAYMLPAPSLIRKTEARREELNLHSLQVMGTLLVTGQAGHALADKYHLPFENDSVTLPAQLSYMMPGRCRLDLAVPGIPEGQQLFAADRNGKVSGPDELKVVQTLWQLVCPWLSSRGGEDGTRVIDEWLKAVGVDFQRSSLARYGGIVAEVVGAGPRETERPQVWIDKDQFVPLRMMTSVKGVAYDAHLIDVGGPGGGGEGLPRAIELYGPGDAASAGQPQLLLRFSADRAEPNAKINDSLFGG